MAASEEFAKRLENRLMSHGVYVTAVDDGTPLELTYETVHGDEGVPHGDIGRVINLLREFRDDGEWDPVDLHAVVTDLEGERLGNWHAEADWFDDLAAGDITETDFSQRVLDSIEDA